MEIMAANPDSALLRGVSYLYRNGHVKVSREMETLEAPGPVMTHYAHPWKRVSFHPERDANPFFHFFESLWILAGRKDVKFLQYFNSNIRNYSDNGETYHGAYGYRLRRHFLKNGECTNMDQLAIVIQLLKDTPDTRQAVLSIWDPEIDLGAQTKDLPCNNWVHFLIHENRLRMTVMCRSNDIVWGAYGSNVVQFSMLHEYVAGMVGCAMGVYTQISDSYHMYTDNPFVQKFQEGYILPYQDPYVTEKFERYPMVLNPLEFDQDLKSWFADYENEIPEMFPNYSRVYANPFFAEVVEPMMQCFMEHKRNKDGLTYVDDIKAQDWQLACRMWLERREK